MRRVAGAIVWMLFVGASGGSKLAAAADAALPVCEIRSIYDHALAQNEEWVRVENCRTTAAALSEYMQKHPTINIGLQNCVIQGGPLSAAWSGRPQLTEHGGDKANQVANQLLGLIPAGQSGWTPTLAQLKALLSHQELSRYGRPLWDGYFGLFNAALWMDGCKISLPPDLASGAPGSVLFDRMLFLGPVEIKNSVIDGTAHIAMSIFAGGLKISETRIAGDAALVGILVGSSPNLNGLVIGDSHIDGGLYVNHSDVNSLLVTATEMRDVRLFHLSAQLAQLSEAGITGRVEVAHSNIDHLQLGHDSYTVRLVPQTAFEKGVRVSFSTIKWLDLSGAGMEGDLIVMDSALGDTEQDGGGLGVNQSEVRGQINVVGGTFSGHLMVDQSLLDGGLVMDGTRLSPRSRFTFSRSQLQRLQAPFETWPNLDGWNGQEQALGALTTEQRSSEPAATSLRRLARLFKSQGDLEAENVATYWAKWHERRVQLSSGGLVSDAATYAQWGAICFPSRCGTSMAVAASSIVIEFIVFCILYGLLGSTLRGLDGSSGRSLSLHLLYLPRRLYRAPSDPVVKAESGWRKRWARAVELSAFQSLRVGGKGIGVFADSESRVTRVLVAVHWVISLWLFAHLVVTLGNTQPLLQRLLSGMF